MRGVCGVTHSAIGHTHTPARSASEHVSHQTAVTSVGATDTVSGEGSAPVALSIHVGVETSRDITRIVCPTHEVRVKQTQTRAAVQLQQVRGGGVKCAPACVRSRSLVFQSALLDRDFHLLLYVKDAHQPHVLCEEGHTGEHAYMVTFYPLLPIQARTPSLA